MSLSSLSMVMPSFGLWDRFVYTHVIMNQTATRIESLINLAYDFKTNNPEAFSITTSPNFIAANVAIVSCLAIGSVPEASTVEVLFGYGILNFVLLSTFLITQTSLEIILDYCLLPNVTFICTCIAVTVFRRLFFSSLNRFPGPKKAAVSNYWMAKQMGNGTFSKTVKDLHKEYDSVVVRTGPNELSVNDAEAIVKIYGGKYQRGPFYEGGKLRGQASIRDTRSNYHHTIWRRIWDKAFTASELKYYSPQIESAVRKLVKILKRKNGEEINTTDAINNFAVDVAADLTFGEDAGMQDGNGDQEFVTSMHKYLSWLGYHGTLRNLVQILGYFPESTDVKTFRTKGDALLVQRQRQGRSNDDITSHLMAEDEETRRKFQVPRQLAANTHLSMLMGAATGTTITQTLRTLAKQKNVQKKLRAEIDAYHKAGGDLSIENIKNLPYLNGVINEALRLHNPLPTGAHATVPAGGIDMGSYKLPAHVQVYVPVLAIMTNEKYFPRGEEFIPERWTDENPELVLDKRAFIPFGYGVHACAGKQLALNEMRVAIAKLIREFELEIGESDDEKKWEDEWRDYSIVKVGDCMLRFKSRKV
ncbi:hypothetical protein ABW19_dt0209144 [Dactylella cylindrospora]|nr:hypothetical protein ABW19_dt0209144 [Dactylella cylindrospora]